jgi:hypothetical protein
MCNHCAIICVCPIRRRLIRIVEDSKESGMTDSCEIYRVYRFSLIVKDEFFISEVHGDENSDVTLFALNVAPGSP